MACLAQHARARPRLLEGEVEGLRRGLHGLHAVRRGGAALQGVLRLEGLRGVLLTRSRGARHVHERKRHVEMWLP